MLYPADIFCEAENDAVLQIKADASVEQKTVCHASSSAEHAPLRKKLTASNAQISSAELVSLRQALKTLNDRVKVLEAEGSTQRQSCPGFSTELASVSRAVEPSSARVEQADAEILIAHQVREALSVEILVAEEASAERQLCPASLAELASMRQVVESSNARMEQMEAEILKARQVHEALSVENLAHRSALETSKAQIKQMTAEALKERQAYHALSAELASLRKELEASNVSVDQVKAEASQKCQDSSAELVSPRPALKLFKASIARSNLWETKAEALKQRQSCPASSAELASLRRAVESSNARVEQAEAEILMEDQMDEAPSTAAFILSKFGLGRDDSHEVAYSGPGIGG
eukprot:gnl/TRDRNA2_/TRDRNA2_163301_c0_seq1.p1 gnl/TRDRNA2_/TRDRNA2_163301_c0~~gnl/TRDRNA2_/TRDRNA2_163301_c0_seq1.p1  ORF type:complete len:351 (+),score=88.64 gnl/TRDRNA2_/TRDRNA2_163301_c0_seq1:36-1088(+)